MENKMSDIPFCAISNDDLNDPEDIREGDLVYCYKCGFKHPIKFGTNDKGKKTNMIGGVRCGYNYYLVMVSGRLIKGDRFKESK